MQAFLAVMATESVLKVVGSNAAEEGAGIFVDMLAHDLRSPLGTIMLAVDHLLGSDDVDVARTAARIAASAARMRRMIDDLLDLARTNRSHLRLRCTSFDLGICVSKCWPSCAPPVLTGG